MSLLSKISDQVAIRSNSACISAILLFLLSSSAVSSLTLRLVSSTRWRVSSSSSLRTSTGGALLPWTAFNTSAFSDSYSPFALVFLSLGPFQVALEKNHLLLMGASDDRVAGGAFHLIKDLVKNISNDIVQNMHRLSCLAITLRTVASFVVANVADTFFLHTGPVCLTVYLSVSGQRQPPAAVSTEHITGEQGLSSGIQREVCGTPFAH